MGLHYTHVLHYTFAMYPILAKEKGPLFFLLQSGLDCTCSDNVMFLNHLASNIALCEADPN